jgi:glycosyltransferase involved in cell wall biosynthesis
VVVPSECYEGLPMTIVEAFACGTPVITSKLPSMDELVTDGVNGARFECGSGEDLARRIEELWPSPQLRGEMRRAARMTYEKHYTPQRNYRSLMKIYERALYGTDSLGEDALVPEKVLDPAD